MGTVELESKTQYSKVMPLDEVVKVSLDFVSHTCVIQSL